MIDSDHVVI